MKKATGWVAKYLISNVICPGLEHGTYCLEVSI
jgi:hypothetical protein